MRETPLPQGGPRKSRNRRKKYRKKTAPSIDTAPTSQSQSPRSAGVGCKTSAAEDEDEGDQKDKSDETFYTCSSCPGNQSRSPPPPFSPRITVCPSGSPSLESVARAESEDQPKHLDPLDDLPSSRPISLACLTAKTHSKNKGAKWKPFPVGNSESGASEMDSHYAYAYGYGYAVNQYPLVGTPSSVHSTSRPVGVVTAVDTGNASSIAPASRALSRGPGHHVHPQLGDPVSFSSPTMPDRSARRRRPSMMAVQEEVPEPTGPRPMGPDDLSPTKHEEKLAQRSMQFNTQAQAATRVEHYMSDAAAHFYQPQAQYGVNSTLGFGYFGYPQGLAIPVAPSSSHVAAQQHADFVMRSRQNGISVQEDVRNAVYSQMPLHGQGAYPGSAPKASLPKSVSTPALSEIQRISRESSPVKYQQSSKLSSATNGNVISSSATLGVNGSYVNRKVSAPVSSVAKTPSNHTVSNDVSPLSKRQTPTSEPKVSAVPQETLSRVKTQHQQLLNKNENASQAKPQRTVQSLQASVASMARASLAQPAYIPGNGMVGAYTTVPQGVVASRPVPWGAISKNTSPPKAGYKFLPPGLPVPSNREKQVSALETLLEGDEPVPGSRLAASNFWFNNEGRSEEQDNSANGEKAKGKTTLGDKLGLDNEKRLEREHAVWSRLCENLWSYKQDQISGADGPFAKFQPAPSYCHEQSYGGKRTFFDTNPLTDTWRLPPKFNAPSRNKASYSYDKGKGKERSTGHLN